MIDSLDDMDDAIPNLLDWYRSNFQVEKGRFSSRSEAGKYAAHIRWMNQRGETPLTVEAWIAGRATDATSVPSRLTASGVDWDQPVPQFKTEEEAQAWVNAKWGKRDGGLSDREFRIQISADHTDAYKGESKFYGFLNVEAAQFWVEGMDRLFKEFPEIANTIGFVAGREYYLSVRNPVGWANRGNASLFLNRGQNSDMDVVVDRQRKWREINFASTDHPSHPLWHEFGHHLGFVAGNVSLYGNLTETKQIPNPRTSQWYNYEDGMDTKAYKRAIRLLVKPHILKSVNNDRKAKGLKPINFKGLSEAMRPGSVGSEAEEWRGEIRKQLSNYSLTSYDEMVAESFAQYAHGIFTGAEISPLARGVVEGLRGYIAGKPLIPVGGS